MILNKEVADWDEAVSLGLCLKEWADKKLTPTRKKLLAARAANSK